VGPSYPSSPTISHTSLEAYKSFVGHKCLGSGLYESWIEDTPDAPYLENFMNNIQLRTLNANIVMPHILIIIDTILIIKIQKN
jgi:hypothetical protein